MENMHDHITVIDDQPLAGRVAVHRMGLDVFFRLQPVLDLPGDRLEMRLGCPRADEKKIGEAGNPAQVERDDILCFFVGCEFRAEFG
jgi:hypothetical protein